MKAKWLMSVLLLCISFVSNAQITFQQSGPNLLINNFGTRGSYPKTGISLILTSGYLEVRSETRSVIFVRDYTKVTTPASTSLADLYAKLTPLISIDAAQGVVYGTGAGTAAQGNDSRINNGQTAFTWGNHALMGYMSTPDNVTSNASNLTLSASTAYYTFTGTTATWTLPPVAGNTKLRIILINSGSGNVTLNSAAGGSDIDDSGSARATMPISPGERYILYNNSAKYIIVQ